MEPQYDYAAFKRELLRGLPGRAFNLWRYHEVLPVSRTPGLDNAVGGTPLKPSLHFAETLDLSRLYFKDERYGPTNSFKDRQAAVAVAVLQEGGVHEMVIASTGNAAVAYAAACAQTGIKLWVFMTSMVPPEKLREVALFGAEVIKVIGYVRPDQANCGGVCPATELTARSRRQQPGRARVDEDDRL